MRRRTATATLTGLITLGCTNSEPPSVTALDASVSGSGTGARASSPPGWKLVRHERFDGPFHEPSSWTEDTLGPASPWHVGALDAFNDDGAFFHERGGAAFTSGLSRFRAFRKSFPHGDDGWLTVELYGRDSDKDGAPETAGRFVAQNGRARLVSTRHYDGAMIRSTHPLPRRYRVEVTVSAIRFGGKRGGAWAYDGKTNGQDGDEIADPWRFTHKSADPISAVSQNGVYFLCITDYPRPAPHNNVFIHHHRKVVMDTDNNMDEWSSVWDPALRAPAREGSQYVSMLWLDGESFGSDWTGNTFVSWTPGGWQSGPIFVDQYLEGESYVFSVERDGESYTLSASGRFLRGGATTYRATRKFREKPVTWHYNQAPDEYGPPHFNEEKRYGGKAYATWPEGSGYPDYFFFGDPHINFYEGTAEFDDVKLYLPETP